MQPFPKPRIMVSRCLGFDHCRYNGATIPDEFVNRLREHVSFITVCPEVEIGLGIPRDPIRIIESAEGTRLVQPSTGRDVTAEMEAFSSRFLGSLHDIDGFLLKSRSPSCGFKDVKLYGNADTITGKGAGMFARAVVARHPDTAVEDEGRLSNFSLREHFLIRVFTAARFRTVRDSGSIAGLVRFQAENKLLLMAYNQRAMRELGRIVANPDRLPAKEVIARYGCALPDAFSRAAACTANINVLMHALGYFSERLTSDEKAFFLDALDRFRKGEIPLSALAGVMQSWITRFHEPYLADQTYFAAYPDALVQVTDSGKGRAC